MATKAEQFKAQQQRTAKAPKAKSKAQPKRNLKVDTAKPGVSATDRKAGSGSTATRNASGRAKSKGGAKLEDSATGKPSRKSTRKSEGHVKAASSLSRRETRKVSSPKARATRSASRK